MKSLCHIRRYMGEGYVVMMSNLVELYYYIDEPGIVEEEPVLLTLGKISAPAMLYWECC